MPKQTRGLSTSSARFVNNMRTFYVTRANRHLTEGVAKFDLLLCINLSYEVRTSSWNRHLSITHEIFSPEKGCCGSSFTPWVSSVSNESEETLEFFNFATFKDTNLYHISISISIVVTLQVHPCISLTSLVFKVKHSNFFDLLIR